MIPEAYIAGQIGQAIYREDDRYFVIGTEDADGPHECRPGDMAAFRHSGAEIDVMSEAALGVEQLRRQLRSRRDAHSALALTISGFDPRLSDKTRMLAIEAVEELMDEEAHRAFVRHRLLARPLPEEADLAGAIRLAEAAHATAPTSLYHEVSASQAGIQSMTTAWVVTAPEFFEEEEERAAQEKALIEMGVFADMVEAITKGERLDNVVMKYGVQPDFKQRIPRGIHLLNALKTHIVKHDPRPAKETPDDDRRLPESAEEAWVDAEEDPIQALIGDIQSKKKRQGRRRGRRRKRLSLDKVVKQVDARIKTIGQFIRQRDWRQVDQHLQDLLEFQLGNSRREDVAKTLCNLAGIAIDAGAYEPAGQWVEYAMTLGVEDVVIWNIQAELLKAMSRMEEALSAYETTIERFPENVVARNGRASLLILMGRYQDARAFLPDDNLVSLQDWIGYHILAMSYLRAGENDEAIRRLSHGVRHVPWSKQRSYFVTALGVAKMMNKIFDEALELLQTDIPSLPGKERQARTLFISHAQAELGQKEEARRNIATVGEVRNPRIYNLREALVLRYDLNGAPAPLSEEERVRLDKQIEEQEFYLIMPEVA